MIHPISHRLGSLICWSSNKGRWMHSDDTCAVGSEKREHSFKFSLSLFLSLSGYGEKAKPGVRLNYLASCNHDFERSTYVCHGGMALTPLPHRVHQLSSKSVKIRRPLEGHPLPRIHHLVGCSETPCYRSKMMFAVRNQSGSEPKPELLNYIVQFPKDYQQVLQQAKTSTQAALKDGKLLLEVEFPTAGLETVPGDEEGGIEMTTSMFLMREFCLIFKDEAPTTRIFFPDVNDMDSAKGSMFEGTSFKLDYLTKPSGLEDFGFSKKVKMADRAQASDKIFLVAYPYFNVNEIIAVEELYKSAAETSGRPIIIFNGELDRIRSGYYPSFFYPKLGSMAKEFLPKFETVYYIHNFKGTSGGVLFRAYPGPGQILRRVQDEYVLVHQQPTMPALKEVALNILPSA